MAAGSKATTPHERGREIYNYRCYFCHGYSGDAKTVAASYLSPPPRSFVTSDPDQLTREGMISAVRDGRPGTAMMSFAQVISEAEVGWVVDFVRNEFMSGQARPSRYHTAANGWPDHERFADAFPFVTGEIPLSQPLPSLERQQREGRKIYLEACVICHDRPLADKTDSPFNRRSISFPRGLYDHKRAPNVEVDAVSGASPYAQHDIAQSTESTESRVSGEKLFLDNCAFCHAADGTGKNWIGSFLQPHPRDLTAGQTWSRSHLLRIVAEGIPGTTMPAWRNVLSQEQIELVVDFVVQRFRIQSENESTHGDRPD